MLQTGDCFLYYLRDRLLLRSKATTKRGGAEVGKSKVEIVGPPEILEQIQRGVEKNGTGNRFDIRVTAVCEDCDNLQVERLSLTVLEIDDRGAIISFESFETRCEKDDGVLAATVLEAKVTLMCGNGHTRTETGEVKIVDGETFWVGMKVRCPKCREVMEVTR